MQTRVHRWDRVRLPASAAALPEGQPRSVRYDQVQQQPADLDPPQRAADGSLIGHAAIAVPGIMEYQDAAGNITLELIPEEELHDPDSLASLAGLAVTLGHPDEDVSPDNVGALGVGALGFEVEVLSDTGHVRVTQVTKRRDALDAIASGMVEVSPGYTCFIDPTPGVHPRFGRYDAIQRGRRYNHLAIVDEARGGPTVKLRADGARRATRRMDAAPATLPPTSGARTMNAHLLSIMAILGLPFSTRADGKTYRRDMEGEAMPVTEEMLAAAIMEAIQGLKGKAEAADMKPEEGEDAASYKATIMDLEGQVAALTAAKADRDRADAEAAEAAEVAKVDAIATKLGLDPAAWDAKLDSAARKLEIVRAQKLVGADETPEIARMDGMLSVLSATAPRQDGASQWEGLKVDPKVARDDGAEKPPADPFKAKIKARNDAARKAAQA